MLPKGLDGWTIELVRSLMQVGYLEAESLDYKGELPQKGDSRGKERLTMAFAAFANSGGGFLVFGVADESGTGLRGLDRLEGVREHPEFAAHLSAYPARCVPSVPYQLLNPGLPLSVGKLIHVAFIPRSWKAPHAVGSAKEGFRYPKRTNVGTEYMEYSEVQQMFLGYHEKRLRLQLLKSELAGIRAEADRLSTRGGDANVVAVGQSILDVSIVESVIGDTYSITASSAVLLDRLAKIRNLVRQINNADRSFVAEALEFKRSGMIAGAGSLYTGNIRIWSLDLKKACTEASSELDQILA